MPIFSVEGVAWSAQRILTAINLGFIDRSHYFFFKLTSRGRMDPVPDPLPLRKSGNAGTSGTIVKNSDH
jgi:hypothetical protein